MRPVRLLLVGVVLAGAALAGCGDDKPKAPEKVSTSGVYAAVIRSLLLPAAPGQELKDRSVYVVARAGVKVNLDVQANVVRFLEDDAKVQWVDDADEALMGDEVGAPVRSDGIVVGVGPVPETPPPVTVYADRVTRRGTVEAFISTVELQGEEWAVVNQASSEPQADPRV